MKEVGRGREGGGEGGTEGLCFVHASLVITAARHSNVVCCSYVCTHMGEFPI